VEIEMIKEKGSVILNLFIAIYDEVVLKDNMLRQINSF